MLGSSAKPETVVAIVAANNCGYPTRTEFEDLRRLPRSICFFLQMKEYWLNRKAEANGWRAKVDPQIVVVAMIFLFALRELASKVEAPLASVSVQLTSSNC